MVSLSCNIFESREKLATFKISYLNQQKISADEYFLCVG